MLFSAPRWHRCHLIWLAMYRKAGLHLHPAPASCLPPATKDVPPSLLPKDASHGIMTWGCETRTPLLGCSPLLQQSTPLAAGSMPRLATPGPLQTPACRRRAHPQRAAAHQPWLSSISTCFVRLPAETVPGAWQGLCAPLHAHPARVALMTGHCPACSTGHRHM